MIHYNREIQTGIEKIDLQHMEIIDQINRILENRSEKPPMEPIGFLLNYVGEHFDTEEKHMQIHEYPQIGEHKIVHQNFREEIIQILEEFTAYGMTRDLSFIIYEKAIPWIIQHINTTDKELARFLQKSI